MLAPDVEIIDIDGRHWANWLELLTPPAVMHDPRWAVVFIENGQVVKAVANGRGSIPLADVPFAGTDNDSLNALRDALDVGAVIVLEPRVLPELLTLIDGGLRLGDDIVAQGLTMLRALKKVKGAGLWVAPPVLDIIPTPPAEALQRTFDLLIPNGSTMAAYVFEDDGSDIYASIIATKEGGHVDVVTTHLGIEDKISATELAGSWRSQHKRATRIIADRFAKPSVCLWMERSAYYRIATGPTDTFTRELRKRNIVIDPAPTWLLGLLSGATVAMVASRGARAIAKMLPQAARKLASDIAQQAQGIVAGSGASPWAMLGFDPIELWQQMRRYYRLPETHDEDQAKGKEHAPGADS